MAAYFPWLPQERHTLLTPQSAAREALGVLPSWVTWAKFLNLTRPQAPQL